MEKIIFETELLKVPNIDAAYVCIPSDVHKALGGSKRMKVVADINGAIYRGSIMDMGLGMMLGVTREIRKKIGKNPGDKVTITISEDKEERIVEVPEDLQQVLIENPRAAEIFEHLSYTNRKEYCRWITDAKREETRKSRVEKTVQLLLQGKKNPFEK